MPSDVTEPAISPDEIEAIRAQVRALMEAEKLTMVDVAKASGIAYGTFTAWLGKTYAGNNVRVAEQVRRWLESRKAAARAHALAPRAPAFIETPAAEAFFAGFEHAQHMQDLVVITGVPGTGKTSAAEAYRARTPNVWVITGEPTLNSPASLLEELADRIGLHERASGGRRISQAIVRRLAGCGGLLIVDEAQHLPSPALDQLRTIHDLARIGTVLLGNETVYGRIGGGARSAHYAQLSSRVGMRLARNRVTKRDVDMLLDAWNLAGKEERALLHAIARKPGALRNLTKTIRFAHLLAGAAGAEAVTESHIKAAWERLANGGGEIAQEAA
jgi:hypothetical protein